MSETPTGPDWWQASDGKWYSPDKKSAAALPPPPPPDPKPPAKKQSLGCGPIIGVFAALLVILFIWGAISAAKKDDSGSSSSVQDGAGELACAHFSNIASDAKQGVLGPDELLPKIREVWNDAQYSTTPGVREGARELLSALNGNGGDVSAATQRLATACGAVG